MQAPSRIRDMATAAPSSGRGRRRDAAADLERSQQPELQLVHDIASPKRWLLKAKLRHSPAEE